ncbi:hypothetical protein AB6A23_26250 [Paenibacillus tarimensis]
MPFTRKLIIYFLAVLLVLAGPAAAAAAPFEFTITVKKAFDKMTAGTNQTTAAKLNKLYADLQTIQKEDLNWDKKISEIHYRNEENALLVRKRINEIDSAKIARLEAELVRTKDRYKPLFALYESLKQQLKTVKAMKNKEMTSVLRTQVDNVKAAVHLAKQDIRAKEAALKAAKSARAQTKKRIRSILADINPVKVKIKAEKSNVSRIKKQFTAETKLLNQAVRKGEVTASMNSFSRLLRSMRLIIGHKSNILSYEQRISAIIAKALAQLNLP